MTVIAQSTTGLPKVYQVYDTTIDTTNSTTYVQAYRFSPNLLIGDYILWWSVELDDTPGYESLTRIQIDDTVTVTEFDFYALASNGYDARAGMHFFSIVASGVVDIDIDFLNVSGGSTTSMKNKRLIVMRVTE